MTDRVLDELTRVVESARGKAQPPELVHAAKRMIMDAVGCAFGGFEADAPAIARRLAMARPLSGGCSVLGVDQTTTPEEAAFANGAMIRYLDYNDSYGSAGGIGHPSDYIPAALAAAQRSERSGADVLDAVVVACAVARGDVTVADFGLDSLADPRIGRLLDNLVVEEDPECEAAWPQACLNKVTLILRGGQRRTATVRYYRGHARNPLGDDELEAKFIRQAAPVLGDLAAGRLAEAIWTLDEAPGVAGLFNLRV